MQRSSVLGRENDLSSLLDIQVEKSSRQLDESVWSLVGSLAGLELKREVQAEDVRLGTCLMRPPKGQLDLLCPKWVVA